MDIPEPDLRSGARRSALRWRQASLDVSLKRHRLAQDSALFRVSAFGDAAPGGALSGRALPRTEL